MTNIDEILFDEILGLTHHAYFIHHREGVIDRLKDFFKNKLNIKDKQNPDFYHEKFVVLSIDDSRKLKELHTAKSFDKDSKRIFIIECFSITHEAQNSLLKIFEEPNESSYFFIFMPNAQLLLPTLRSRLFITKKIAQDESGDFLYEANKFIKMSLKDRVAFVDELAKDIMEEKKTKVEAVAFLSALEQVLYEKTDMRKITLKEKQVFDSILKARNYLNDRSPSIKQLLEFVAISL